MEEKNSEKTESGGKWCPICGAEFSVTVEDGKQVLRCPRHGMMLWCLFFDPLAVAKHCDDLGIVDLEAGAKFTAAVAEGSFSEVV